jgi:hypothetical protein
MSTGAVRVSDETISAVAVGLVAADLIGLEDRGTIADGLATANRFWIHHYWGEPPALYPEPVVGHPWRWRPLAPAIELLTRLDYLRANLHTRDIERYRLEDLRDVTVRRLPGYGSSSWQK